MEKIGVLVRSLVLIVAVTAFLELLLPVGEMRRYVRMVMGVLILVTVLQVLVGFLHRPDGFAFPQVALEPGLEARPDYDEVCAGCREQALEAYRQGLARQVEAVARIAGLEVARVEVVLEGPKAEYPRLKEIELHLEQAVPVAVTDAGGVENAARTIADFYNLPPERVRVTTP
jgi:stage III sporulation protein AF